MHHSQKSDIWSLGLLMLKILGMHEHPFGDPSRDLFAYKHTVCSIGQDALGLDEDHAARLGGGAAAAAAANAAAAARAEQAVLSLLPPNVYSASVRLFIKRCLDRNPHHRPSVCFPPLDAPCLQY